MSSPPDSPEPPGGGQASTDADASPLEGELSHSVYLLNEARDGRSEALNQLFVRYYDRVSRIARIRTGNEVLAWMDWDDIVQDTFLRASRDIRDIHTPNASSIIRWLARVCENVIRDKVAYVNAAKRSKVREVPIDFGDSSCPGLGDLLTDGGDSPSERVGKSELKARYDAAVAELPEHDREVILLRKYAGASWKEIAEIQGRPSPEAAREHCRRVEAKLAGKLKF